MDPEILRRHDALMDAVADVPVTDDAITLTQGEWQELVSSIQSLVQANHALLQTVSELMNQRNQAIAQPAPPPPVPLPGDTYDLRVLNHLLNGSS